MEQREFDRLIELKQTIARSMHTAAGAYRRHLLALRHHVDERLSFMGPVEYRERLRLFADTRSVVG
ncbi:MAG: hypothetical protein HY722_04295 [Planctomycetes bacterium]|nr:hypothetical protein [Planctomycetota bacterium]